MSRLRICILAHGRDEYVLSARQTVFSCLQHSDLPISVVHEPRTRDAWPHDPRVTLIPLPELDVGSLTRRFLVKFTALDLCRERSSESTALMLDADAVLVGRVTEDELLGAMGGRPMAMAEQEWLRTGGWQRAEHLELYRRNALATICPESAPPALEAFHFFNSGFLLLDFAAFGAFRQWFGEVWPKASQLIALRRNVLVTDQDFLQVWAHQVRKDACAVLPWHFNHCWHWHRDYPAKGAKVLHFSNFLQGPSDDLWRTMEAARNGLYP